MRIDQFSPTVCGSSRRTLGLPNAPGLYTSEPEMDSSTQRSDGFAMAVVVEGGLALVALVVAWLFRVTLRDMFPPVGPPLVSAILRGLLATLPMLVIFWLLVN